MKISAALLRFARPLTDLLPPVPSAAELQSMLELAQLVWNAVVLEELRHASPYLGQARASVKREMSEPARGHVLALLGDLERRKRGETPPDLRLIGAIEIRQEKNGGHSLFATQIAPPGSSRTAAAGPASTDPWAELYSAAREFH